MIHYDVTGLLIYDPNAIVEKDPEKQMLKSPLFWKLKEEISVLYFNADKACKDKLGPGLQVKYSEVYNLLKYY